MSDELKPCPFCGGPVELENPIRSEWWGVVCRNTINLGGTCAIEQRPSRSKEAAIERWNRRAPSAPVALTDAQIGACALVINGICMTHEQYAWVELIERRIRFMLAAQPASGADAKDAERYRWLRDTLHGAKAGGGVEVNDALQVYETPTPGEEVRIYWYQDTPVGFYESQASNLDDAVDAAIAQREKGV